MADQKAFKKRLKALMNKKENLTCADCPEKQPRWASLIKPPPGSPDQMGMGAFMCLECSGSHRRLGVHISFVRSVNLDSWKEHEVQIMENGGNAKVNAAFEALLSRSGVRKPDTTANGQQRERYIRDKYERRKFYDPSALQEYESEEDDEEDIPQKPARRTTKKPVAALSRAPSEAAQRRAAQRQARLTGTPSVPDRPARINIKKEAPKPAPQADLLDFANFESAPAPVAPAPVAPPPAAAPAPTPSAVEQKNETLDLFANMSVSGPDSGAGAAPPKKTNQDIMSLFNTPQANNPMFAPQMMVQPQQGQSQQMNPMMMQQMMMQQQMMMMQQQNTSNVNQPGAPNTSQQVGMMGMNQGGMMQQQNPSNGNQPGVPTTSQQVGMMSMNQGGMMQQQNPSSGSQPGVPASSQQVGMMGMNQGGMQGMMQQPQNNMAMNNMTGQQMNPMMMQQANIQGMAPQQQQPGVPGMQMMMQPTPNNGNFGGMAPMGSGPTMQKQQTPSSPQKEDPFSQFGVNSFR